MDIMRVGDEVPSMLDSHEMMVTDSGQSGRRYSPKEAHMDITYKDMDRVLDDLTTNGGGTYDRRTLQPFTPDDGFAVAIGGFIIPEDDANPATLAWSLYRVAAEYGTTYAGTWLDDGVVYIDAVQYYPAFQRELAIAAGIKADQKAIYDFGASDSIVLGTWEEE